MNEKLEKTETFVKNVNIVDYLVIKLMFVTILNTEFIICFDLYLFHRSALPSSSGVAVSALSDPLMDVILPKMCSKMTHPM